MRAHEARLPAVTVQTRPPPRFCQGPAGPETVGSLAEFCQVGHGSKGLVLESSEGEAVTGEVD